MRRVAASRSIFFGLTAALTLLLLTGLVIVILNAPNVGKVITDLAHGLTTGGGVTTLGDCPTCPTLTPWRAHRNARPDATLPHRHRAGERRVRLGLWEWTADPNPPGRTDADPCPHQALRCLCLQRDGQLHPR